MNGHIQTTAKDRHTIFINLGLDPVTGKRQRVVKRVRGKKSEAQQVMREMMLMLGTPGNNTAAKPTVKELLRLWLESVCQPRLAATTVAGYRMAIENHILPSLGHIKLNELQPYHVQQLQAKLQAKKLSARTCQWVHTTLKTALKHAVRWGQADRNVADLVDSPKPQRTIMSVVPMEQLQDFLTQADQTRIGPLVRLAIWTGMRRGELLGLVWGDVDLERGVITVQRARVRVDGEDIIKAPKTSGSRRRIPLPIQAVMMLAAIKGNTSANQPVFDLASPSAVSHQFKDLADRTGHKGLRFHDLRHTHATLLLQSDVSAKIVQERLGHGSISTTLNIYAHVVPEMQMQAVRALENLTKQDRKQG